MLSHYGTRLGIRNARKHIAWYLEHLGLGSEATKDWRRRLCTADDVADLHAGLRAAFAAPDQSRPAA